MFLKTKNRKALSAVLTTLIILVASVVLGTGVVLFGTSLFQTNARSSDLAVQGAHVWINTVSSPTFAWGAAEIRNSGDKILSVDQINVRGTQIPFSNWYYDSNPIDATTANFQSQLNYTGTATAAYISSHTGAVAGMMQSYGVQPTSGSCAGSISYATQFYINEFGPTSTVNPTLCLSQASGPISLKPGDRVIVYFELPNGVLSTVDGGSNSNVAVYAGSVGSPQSITIQSQPN